MEREAKPKWQSSVLFYHITGPKESSPLMYEAGEDLLWNQLVVEFLELRFAGFTSIALPAFIVSYIFFFGIGGFLHVSAYIINYSRPPQVGIPGIPSFFLPKCFRKVVNFDLRFYIEGDY